MRRAALAAAFLGLIGSGLGCRAVFGCNDCVNDPTCQPLPAYANPYPVVGPTQTGGGAVAVPGLTGSAPALPSVPVPIPAATGSAPTGDKTTIPPAAPTSTTGTAPDKLPDLPMVGK